MRKLETAQSDGHIIALDGIRGAAIVLVLLFHGAMHLHASLLPAPLRAAQLLFRSVGWAGVDLFFVLSGFLITGILLKTRDRPRFLTNFYARRVLRIFPLYYATLGLLAATAIVQSIRHSKFPGALFFHNQIILWSYTQNIAYALQGWRQLAFPLPVHISHFWSLAVEEQFYLFWPFVIYFAGRRAGLIISLALIFAAAALRVALLTSWHNETAAYVLLPCRMDALAMGASLSLWVSGGVSPRRISRVAIFILALCFPIMAAYVAFNSAEGLEYQLWVQTLGFTLIAATSAAIIALCILKESVAAKLASLAALRFLGKYSYGIYVIHFLILDRIVTSLAGRLGALGIPYWMAGTSALCIYYSGVVFAAYLSWNLFEKHFIRMKRYFEPGPDDASSNRVFASGSAGFVDHD